MRHRGATTSRSRAKTPRERVRRQVERHRRPPRPVPWWALAKRVLGVGFGFGFLLLTLFLAAVADATGVAPPGAVATVGLAVTAGGVVVDVVRLWRLRRAVRHGVVLTATVTDEPAGPTRLPGQRRRRTVPHPSGAIHDDVRVPDGAPDGEFHQSVLVDPHRPVVWLTLHKLEVLPDAAEEAASRPSGERLAGWPPLVAATARGRLTAAWRAGLGFAFVGFVAAAGAAQTGDDGRAWLLALLGPAVAAVAAARVRIRVDERGVRVRSALWTRSRRWDELERLTVAEVIIAGYRGGTITADVLAVEDYLGVRLRASATVRCWEEEWLAELVRRCETAGVSVDPAVTRALSPGEADDQEAAPGRGRLGDAMSGSLTWARGRPRRDLR